MSAWRLFDEFAKHFNNEKLLRGRRGHTVLLIPAPVLLISRRNLVNDYNFVGIIITFYLFFFSFGTKCRERVPSVVF